MLFTIVYSPVFCAATEEAGGARDQVLHSALPFASKP